MPMMVVGMLMLHVDDDIDDFIDNAVAIVVLLVMSRMKVIG